MKNLIKRIACTVLALATVMLCGVFADADTVTITTASEARNGVVYIETNEGSGTGFAIGEPGKPIQYIVTNAHVVSNGGLGTEAVVVFGLAEKNYQIGTVVKISTRKDIAVLKLEEPTTERTALVFCTSEDISYDDNFTALGFPFNSLKENYDINDVTMTRGIVSKKTFIESYGDYCYQMDVEIHPGNSGGPLVNSKGQVVGINSFSIPQTDQYGNKVNTNYAICIDEVVAFLSKSEYGYVLSTEISDEAPATSESNPANNDNDDRQSVPADNNNGNSTPVPAGTEKSGSSATTVIIIVAVVVVAAAAGVVVVMMMKKGGSAAAAPAAPSPSPSPVQITPPQNNAGAVLICEKGVLAGRTYSIGNGVVIGRNPQQCNVCFPVDAKGVSGTHCSINKTANGFEIVDLGSSYGTTLGSGQKLTPNVPVFLPSGTYIMVGGSEQVFQIKY